MKRPGVGRPDSDELRNALRQEQRDINSKEKRGGVTVSRLELGIAGVLILVVYGILIGTAVPPSIYVVTVTGGGTAMASQTAFVDPRGTALFLDALRTLTAGCMLAPTDPAMALATIGTHQHTNAGWAAIVAALAGNFTNGTGCQFYGLEATQSRAGGTALLGPADMCHAYVNIGIDLLHALAGFHMPVNITTYLNLAFDLAYPLNIFWQNTNDPAYMRQQVTARLYLIVQCLTQPGTDCTARPIDVQGIATQFCNPFFASDDLTYYNAAFMPWLKFPFPGLMPRDGDNVFASQVRRLLSPQSVAQLIANGTTLNASVVAVYVLDDPQANGTDVLDLALDALLAGVPRYYPPPFGGSTRAFLELVANHLQALDQGETVVVAARYARDFNLFNSVNFVRAAGSFPPPLFFLFSNFVTPADGMPVTPANLGLVPLEIQNFATSAQVVNLLDVVHTLTGFDGNYSRQYVREKLVATFAATAVNPIFVLNMSATLQLLDTFALKNTVVQGRDLGGHVAAVRQQVLLDTLGYATGYKPLPLAVEAQVQTIVTPALSRNKRDYARYPAAFDYRNGSRSACLRPAFAQGACGESWAVSIVAAQSARFCLWGTTRGWANLSLAHVSACAAVPGISNGCEPGHPAVAATFLSTLGAVSEQCFPATTTPPCDAVPCAPTPCLVNCPGAKYTVFKDSGDSPLYYRVSGIEALKSELYHNGPLVTCYDLPVDFYAFFAAHPTGCYSNDTAPAYGGDCAVAVGYSGDRLYLRSSTGAAFANGGDFCVNMTATRLRSSAWFANEAWGALTGGVSTRSAPTVPIPAGSDRTPSLIISPPTTILAVEPVNRG